MYILLTFWALLALFYRVLDLDWTIEVLERCNYDLENDTLDHYDIGKRSTNWYLLQIVDRLNQVRFGIRYSAAAAVPALVLSWLLCCALGLGAHWDAFFPGWFVDGVTAAGGVFCDYLLDHFFWEVR